MLWTGTPQGKLYCGYTLQSPTNGMQHYDYYISLRKDKLFQLIVKAKPDILLLFQVSYDIVVPSWFHYPRNDRAQ